MKRLIALVMMAAAGCRAQDAQPQPASTPTPVAPAQPQPEGAQPFFARDWARVPVGYKAVQFGQSHKLADCLLDFAKPVADATDGTLFIDETTSTVFHVVHGDRFHLHAIHADGKDEVLIPDKEGELEIPAGRPAPAKYVLCTTAFFLDGGGRRLFVPPYAVSYRVEPLEKMTALLSIQEFALHIADDKGEKPHSVVTTLARNPNEFTFGYYNLTMDRRNVLTGAYLCANESVIPEPTYRASVKNKDGRVFQKVEVLPYPPGAQAAPQGAEFFDFEHDGRIVERVPVPPRPVLAHPDTAKQPLPFVNVTAHLYGFATAKYSLTTSQGFPRSEDAPWLAIDTKEVTGETRTVTTTIQPDANDKGEAIERTAFYSIRLARLWASKSGFLPAPRVLVSRNDEHKHTFYIMLEKLPHVVMFNLAGVPPSMAQGGPGFGTLGLMALNDAAIVGALGGRPLGVSGNPSMSGGGDRINVTVVNNHGLGGGGGGGGFPVGGGGGGGDLASKLPMYINTGTVSFPWAGQPPAGSGMPGGSTLPPIGWQSRFNQPKK